MKEQLDALIKEIVEHGIAFEDARNEFEKRFIKRVLEKYKGNRCRAAETLGIHRNTLSRKIEEFGLDHAHRHRRRR